MKVTDLETNEIGGIELLVRELDKVWGEHSKVIEAVRNRRPYEEEREFTDWSGWHSKWVYVTPFDDDKVSVEIHWGYKPALLPGESYGGCDLELEVVA